MAKVKLDLLITHANIATMQSPAGPRRGRAMQDIGLMEDAVVGVQAGRIAYIGSAREAAATGTTAEETVDAGGRLLTPGLVDPHTHLVHAASREHELAKKLAGVPYLQILAEGGGILSTVRSTRAASEDDLLAQAKRSALRMLLHGTTTVEAKSGYGLDRDTELRQLRVAQRLCSEVPIDVVPTFLGPHAVPPEAKENPDTFIDAMIALLPEIKSERLAEFADIFCETGVFTVEQSRRFLQAAKDSGFGLKIHADEIEPLGGAELAAELHAVSADHLLQASKDGLRALADAGTVTVLLPGTSWNLGSSDHADARFLIDEVGAPVALATDYNPGSCPTESMQFIMALAANQLRMTPEEILTAATLNSAYAVGRGDSVGSIEVGKQADFCLFEATNPAYLVYHFGINHIHSVWKRGQRVVSHGCLAEPFATEAYR